MNNLLAFLEQTVSWLPEKIAIREDDRAVSFRTLHNQARALGTFLAEQGLERRGIGLLVHSLTDTAAGFFGILSAGGFCILLDASLPRQILENMIGRGKPDCILCDEAGAELLRSTGHASLICPLETARKGAADADALNRLRQQSIDDDPACMIFSPGERNTGVLFSHRSMIDRIRRLSDVLGCGCDTVFGSQPDRSPAECLEELLAAVGAGGTVCRSDALERLSPAEQICVMNDWGVNTLYWTASALEVLSGSGGFQICTPKKLRTVAFSGEPVSARHLMLWRRALPNAALLNLYGTVFTGVCCCFRLNRVLTAEERVPLGMPLPNVGILLLDDQGQESDAGEICIRGSCLDGIPGLNLDPASEYPRRLMHTGDYGVRSDRGELVYLGRKDSRVKIRGRRADPQMVEAAAANLPDCESACCQYEEKTGRLQLFYAGSCSCQEMTEYLKDHLPRFLLPQCLYRLEMLPTMPDGRVDRIQLRRDSRRGRYAYSMA